MTSHKTRVIIDFIKTFILQEYNIITYSERGDQDDHNGISFIWKKNKKKLQHAVFPCGPPPQY